MEKIAILFLIIINIINSAIIFPFRSIQIYSKQNNDPMKILYDTNIYTNLNIGKPEQKIKALLKFDLYAFSLNTNNYDVKISKNIYINENIKILEYDGHENYKNCKDSFNFITLYKDTNQKNKFFNSINFILKFKDELNLNNYAYIGLKYPSNKYKNFIYLIKELKNKKIIDKQIFSFNYNIKEHNLKKVSEYININGNFIIGNNLYEIYNDIYSYKFYQKINILTNENGLNWEIVFDKIYIGDNEMVFTQYRNCELRPDLFYIKGTLDYQLEIEQLFFDIYLKNNICKIQNITSSESLFYYICDKSISSNELKFDITKFPNLEFVNKKNNQFFILDYKDLFVVDSNNNNILYFLIIFDLNEKSNYNINWVLGIPFLKKYEFVFDIDKNIIGYYTEKESTSNIKIIIKKNKYIKYIIFIFIAILLVILGMLIQKKKIKLPRKLRANEIEEDFFYKPNINDIMETLDEKNINK